MHFAHSVNRSGFVSLQRFYLYAEPGLARQRIAIWIYEGTRRLEYQQTLLAQYQVEYDPHTKALQQVSQPRIFSTSFRSPQLALFELDHDQWLHVYERPYHSTKAKPTKPAARQFALISFSLIILTCSPTRGSSWRCSVPNQ
jgi:hypothetical protein